MTYHYSYTHNDNGRIKTISREFDSRDAMEKFISDNNLPHPMSSLYGLHDFFGTHRNFINYLRDVFPVIGQQALGFTSPSSAKHITEGSGRFDFAEYEDQIKKLEDRETQKNKLHADLNKLRSYEEIFKKHNHKEMLKKVQADIAEAEKALKEYE